MMISEDEEADDYSDKFNMLGGPHKASSSPSKKSLRLRIERGIH